MKDTLRVLAMLGEVFLILFLFLWLGWAAGSGCQIQILDKELVKRGLKQYNQQTGQLEWTEKGGGND